MRGKGGKGKLQKNSSSKLYMSKNIPARLYIKFTLKVLIFRVLRPIISPLGMLPGQAGAMLPLHLEPLLCIAVAFVCVIADGKFGGWPATFQPIYINLN